MWTNHLWKIFLMYVYNCIAEDGTVNSVLQYWMFDDQLCVGRQCVWQKHSSFIEKGRLGRSRAHYCRRHNNQQSTQLFTACWFAGSKTGNLTSMISCSFGWNTHMCATLKAKVHFCRQSSTTFNRLLHGTLPSRYWSSLSSLVLRAEDCNCRFKRLSNFTLRYTTACYHMSRTSEMRWQMHKEGGRSTQ